MTQTAADVEFSLIDLIRETATAPREDVLLGIGDDGAVLDVPAGQSLVVSIDTLVEGVHFARDTSPADIGWKSLAVNLSDLAAMGAAPAWVTLALTLPKADADWLRGFLDGFADLARQQGVALVGGDITRGPLSISVQAHGLLPTGQALTRSGARAEDEIWVSGTLGDAACALASLSQGESARSARLAGLLQRLHRPEPRTAAGQALRGLANAAIDLSDGLLADLDHVIKASNVGAQLWLDQLPASAALSELVAVSGRWDLQLTGGDDYELCFTASPERHKEVLAAMAVVDVPAAVIGVITHSRELKVFDTEGRLYHPKRKGWAHFESDQSQ